MKVLFVRAFLPQFDARMSKYVRALEQRGHTARFIGWARGQQGADRQAAAHQGACAAVDLYPRRARLGARWGNLPALLGWNLFVLRTLVRRRHDIDAVHAVDLDSVVAAWLFCRLSGKPLVFDLYDHYADTRGLRGAARALFSTIERQMARHADLTLLADACRYAQHGLSPAAHIRVIENVPDCALQAQPLDARATGPIRIGYLGVFESCHRGLENLLQAFAGQPAVVLHFAGYGPLEPTIAAAARAHDNVILHGALAHEAGLRIMATMDCMVGFYHLTVPNHRYAAPNKYYEHLLLGRALLTTLGTPPGDKVSREESGWALAETVEALRDWRAGITRAELARRGQRARALWDSRYREYAHDTLVCAYVDALLGLMPQTARAVRQADRSGPSVKDTVTPPCPPAAQAQPSRDTAAPDDPPLVSIIMPAYNAANSLDAAICSVLAQTWPHWELLVVVDAATDDTLKIARHWAARDARIQVFSRTVNGGAAQSRNVALQHAHGDYIAFLDSDDLWLPHKLAAQLDYMRSHQVDICYAAYQRFDARGLRNIVVPPACTTYKTLLRGNVIANLTSMARRDAVAGIRFRPVGHEDYLYWLSVLKASGAVARCLPDRAPVARYRVQSLSLSGNKVRALRWQWHIYRQELRLPRLYSTWLMLHYGLRAIGKRLGRPARRSLPEASGKGWQQP